MEVKMFNLNTLPTPSKIGSYSEDDVIFLLKNISDVVSEKITIEREELIQKGVHYSEMLPVEYPLSKEYYNLFYKSLDKYKEEIASYLAILCNKIVSNSKKDLVLVSLARAGTPIGILMKRFIEQYYGKTVPHYSISIIIGKGFDENALKYIIAKHPNSKIQFVDGWTGKGTIKRVLVEGCDNFNSKYSTSLESTLAVLADPCGCAEYFGTTKDFLIPSSFLNSTVSGLVSRTVHRDDIICDKDFHGAKYYIENINDDVSNYFVDEISKYFDLKNKITYPNDDNLKVDNLGWKGLNEVSKIQHDFNVENINHIKPGVGETTRVLLRRVPWKILVSNFHDEDLLHILSLAKEKNVTVEQYPLNNYRCCGIIKNLGDK
jgi:hypothetical protein